MMIEEVPGAEARRLKRGFLLLMLVVVCLLAGLGTWQLNRLAWKEALIEERQTGLAAAPISLSNVSAGNNITSYRRVTVTGTFLHGSERRVGPRTRRGVAGWHVVTPLRLDGGSMVLINRGWVPEDRKKPARRTIGQLAGRVTVEGFIKRPSRQGYFVPENEPDNGQWFTVDPIALAKHLDLSDMAPFWIIAGPAANPGGYPVGGQGITMPPNNHLSYAGTWFGLALLIAVCSVFYWRRD